MPIIESDGPGPKLNVPDDFVMLEVRKPRREGNWFARHVFTDILRNGEPFAVIDHNSNTIESTSGECIAFSYVISGLPAGGVMTGPIISVWTAKDSEGRELGKAIHGATKSSPWLRIRGREPLSIESRSNFTALLSEEGELLLVFKPNSSSEDLASLLYVRPNLSACEANVLTFYALRTLGKL